MISLMCLVSLLSSGFGLYFLREHKWNLSNNKFGIMGFLLFFMGGILLISSFVLFAIQVSYELFRDSKIQF